MVFHIFLSEMFSLFSTLRRGGSFTVKNSRIWQPMNTAAIRIETKR